MKKETTIKLLAGAAMGAAGLTTGIASTILVSKTLLRPGEAGQEIIDKFADPVKMAEYAGSMALVGKWLKEQKLDDVSIRSRDGLLLHAYYLPAHSPSNRLVILHHGFTGNAMDNDAMHAKFFHEQGYEVLLPDLRAHGKSEGKYVGFGILERFDTLEWVKHSLERFGRDIHIVLHGTSMGAATVLMTLGIPEIQETVSAVIADCGYTSPAEIFAYMIRKDYHIPPKPVLKVAGIETRALAGYSYDDYSTLDALQGNRVPVLFIHGREDHFVPAWMTQKNYDTCNSKKELLFVENAGHGFSVLENQPLYEQAEKDFLAEVLGE